MTAILIERIWPYLLSSIATVCWWQFLGKIFPANAIELMSATGNVAAVLVGFLVTAKAIVLSLSGSLTFKALSKAGYDRVFLNYMFEAEVSGIVLLISSITGFFVLEPDGGSNEIFRTIWIFAAFSTLFLFSRVIGLLFSFLKQI